MGQIIFCKYIQDHGRYIKGSLSGPPGRMSTGSWSSPQGLPPIPTQYRPENVFFGIWICDVGPKGGFGGVGGKIIPRNSF